MIFSQRQIKLLIGALVVLVVFGVILLLGYRSPGASEIKLVFWSVYDKPDAFEGLIARFAQETGMKVEFVGKNPETYEQELVDALAAGRGPDILAINNAWLLKHEGKLYPAPAAVIAGRDLQDFYPDVVARDFVRSGYVYGVPLSIDTLALFYNQDALDQAGIVFPPKTWEELSTQVPRLAKISKSGIVERAAVALGTSNNVAHAPDTLALLMMQLGSSMVDVERSRVNFHEMYSGQSTGAEALQFYTRFAEVRDRLFTWSRDFPRSVDAFSQGEVVMIFGYARDIPAIREKAAYLDFRVAPMLQPAASKDRVDYAHYWGYGVARTSRHPLEAWRFIGWVTDLEQARVYMRKANRPPARKELIREVLDERILGVFAKQSLVAQSWYQPDPSGVASVFRTMIDEVNLNRATPEDAVKRGADQINLLFQKFSP